MKDPKGHGSNPKSVPGRAAHQSMVRKTYAAGNVEGAVAHSLTRYDREQQARGKNYNVYALGHYMGAASKIAESVKSGSVIQDAINEHTSGSLANRLHTDLQTGAKARKY